MLNIKKMLSFLVVLAMVIGMVPAVGLPAVVAKADAELSINEQAEAMTFTGGTDNKYCPVCDDNVNWLPLTAGGAITPPTGSEHVHYYVYDASNVNVTVDSSKGSTNNILNVLANVGKGQICLNLNGHNLISPYGGFNMEYGAGKVNIMGKGMVTYTNTKGVDTSRNKALFTAKNGTVNLYGGTYYDMNSADNYPIFLGGTNDSVVLNVHDGVKILGAVKVQDIRTLSFSGNCFVQTLEITGNPTQVSGDTITVNGDFTGRIWNFSYTDGIAEDGTVAYSTSEGFTGSITTADGKKVEAVDGKLKVTTAYGVPTKDDAFAPDTHGGKAWCVHCGAVKNWVPYFGNNTIVLQDGSDVYHFHIYLTEDLNYTGTATNGNVFNSNENICLNLNGYDISGLDADGNTAGKRAIRVTQTLAIMGDPENPGTITAGKTNSTDGAVAKNMKEFYLYAGANLATVAGDTSPAVSCAGNIYLNGGSITGFVSDKEAAATISLANGASADQIKLTQATSKLSVAAGWSGEAVVQLPAALVDGAVPADNGEALGDFTGKLTTSDGTKLGNSNGSLAAAKAFNPNDEINYCEACDDYVTWTALPATEADMDLTSGKHYYVANDMSFTSSNNWLFRMTSRATLCLHLNGRTLTLNNTRVYNGAAGSTVNIIGAGGTLKGTHGAGLFYSDTGNTHLYGGTYLAAGTLGVDPTGAGSQYHLHGNAKLEGKVSLDTGKLHMYDQAVADTIVLSDAGLVTFYEGWTGSAVLDVDRALLDGKTVNTANAVVEGAFGGELTTVAGYPISVSNGALILNEPTAGTFDPWNYEGKAYCQACDAIVTWSDYNAEIEKNGYYYDNAHNLNVQPGVPTHHFYLSEDITYTTQLLFTNDKLHFNFNGCDVTATGETATSAFRITQKSHFFNTGDVATVTGGITGGTVGSVLENGGNVNVPNESDTWIYGNIVMTKQPGGTGPVVNMGSETNVLTVKGNPVIESLRLGTADTLVDISGLTEGASIALTGLTVGQTFTVACDNVDAVKGYVSSLDIVGPFGIVKKQMTVKEEAGIVSGGEVVWYGDNDDAVLAYTQQNFADGAYIILSDEETLTLAGGNYYVDIAGKNIHVSGTGTLYPFDSANDDYEGFGSWTYEGVEIAQDVTLGGNRYITVTADGAASTHRLQMAINRVSLRASAAGLYYTAQYQCDDTLAKLVSAYGVILSLKDMPGAVLDGTDVRTRLTEFTPGVAANSSSVFGIFKEGRSAEKNAEYGRMKIYANAYIQLDLDGNGEADILVADTENEGKTAGTAWSLHDVLLAIDQNWDDYAEDQETIQAFYEQWANCGMSQYADDFENIDEVNPTEGPGATKEPTDMDAKM